MVKGLILTAALIAGTNMVGITVEENVVTTEVPINEKGKQTRRYRANVSFGVANYYYDYEF